MNYRVIGRTGMKVSEIALGCEGFAKKDQAETTALMDKALAAGVNCMDLYASDPDLRMRLGVALKGRRANFIMQAHICSVWQNSQYKRTRNLDEVKAGFADLLDRLQTDYIDIGMIHYVDAVDDWNQVVDNGVLAYAKELKETGKILAIGLSSHNPIAALAAIETGEIDVLMFSVNPCYDLLPGTEECEDLWDEKNYAKHLLNMDPDRVRLYETCQRMGIGITVMKAFGGGDLLSEELSPAGKALTPIQCIHYALTRPGVVAVMTGVHSETQLDEALAYETASDEERDYATVLASMPKISWEGHCMYCGHCAPCPKGIDVASVTKFLNLVRAQGEVPETAREHYEVLTHHASECVECGGCEKRCPFGVNVIENMKAAVKVFGK